VGQTFYSRMGDGPVGLILAAIVLIAGFRRTRQ
jgi:hypothetical protein